MRPATGEAAAATYLTTVRFTEPGRLPRLTSEDFKWLIDTEPTVKAKPATTLAGRLQLRQIPAPYRARNHPLASASNAVIAIVGAGLHSADARIPRTRARPRASGKRDVRPVRAGLSALGAVTGPPCNVNIVCEVIEGAGPNGVPGRPGAGRKG